MLHLLPDVDHDKLQDHLRHRNFVEKSPSAHEMHTGIHMSPPLPGKAVPVGKKTVAHGPDAGRMVIKDRALLGFEKFGMRNRFVEGMRQIDEPASA
jgi:hypothetical protein